MRPSHLAFALFLAAIPGIAAAAEWRLAASADAADSHVDAASIRRAGDQVSFWREIRYRDVQTNAGNGIRFNIFSILQVADCATMTHSMLKVQVRLGDLAVDSYTPEPETEHASPDSVMEGVLRSVCFDEWPEGSEPHMSPVVA
jgi:hypothetical protein